MNIKSLLLGSAAAFVAVSGARAADAVVIAEPEPMEYVRICDTYGVGFYYVPGTETCLRISGYMQYDIQGGDLYEEHARLDPSIDPDNYDVGDGTWDKRARFQMRFDARSETEYGTLRGYVAANLDYRTSDNVYGVDQDIYGDNIVTGPYLDANDGLGIDHLYIELAGFKVGATDSLYATFTGYAGSVINDTIGVSYTPFKTNLISYAWNGGNGFAVAVALEEGDRDEGVHIQDYMPHVVGGVSYTAGWGSIALVAGYDSVNEEGAGRLKVDFNVNDALSLWVMGGYSTDGDFSNNYAPWGGDWAVWGGGRFGMNEKTALNLQVGYDDFENFGIAANVEYELVTNLTITGEVAYADNFDDDGEDGEFGFQMRFRRSF